MGKKQHIVVGLSGGVDSSVSAYLLKNAGHQVTAVFMQNWEDDQDDPHCSASQDLSDARSVCDLLGIPLKTVNFAKRYWDFVFQHFLDEYAAGRTPNPDILCNKEIKFKAFLNYALELGADKIATGHYARIGQHNGDYQLLRGLDQNKDQSYFLYTLGQAQLAKALFPIGELEKSEVRDIAEKIGLVTHNKKDSTGICFIGEKKFRRFLNEYLLARPGKIETDQGIEIGEHQGLMFYTMGQRQGLGIGGLKDFSEEPWYVLDKDIERNVLVVGQNNQHPLLFADRLTCNKCDWSDGTGPTSPINCTAKIRYRQQDQACELTPVGDGSYYVVFDEPQRAITPGQSVVFYQDDACIGGGIITARGNHHE